MGKKGNESSEGSQAAQNRTRLLKLRDGSDVLIKRKEDC